MFKYETHLHTSSCSACAIASGFEMVDTAVEKGYSGFFITNHFYHGNTCVDRNLDWRSFISAYRADYEITKNYGEKMGVQVFFGIEEGYDAGKEMLIYGVAPEVFIETPEFIMLGAKEKAAFVRANGGITVCAHPFRNRSYIPEPDKKPDLTLFDGIEVFNLGNLPEENAKAARLAEESQLFTTAGGDVHRVNEFGFSGMEFTEKLKNEQDFINKLKSGNYKLITKNE